MQTQGSLTQTSLAALLEAMQSERATGTLSVQNGGETCSLYFLFGHLFHASGDLGQGEEAVVSALSWSDGTFTFDPRAKLPAEETIKTATSDLLAEADRRRSPSGNGSSAAVATIEHESAGAVGADAETESQLQNAFASAPAESPASTTTWLAPPPPAAPARPAVPEPTFPKRPPRTAPAVLGNPAAAPLTDMYPLPSGKPVYEGLKSAFVDFPKLLRTLEADGHTGYVRLDGADFAGVLLLHDGHLIEALFSSGELTEAEEAFRHFRDRMERGEGLLDVIELAGETVVALAQLLTAPLLFTGLLARFINFDALLEYLAEEKVDGSLVVTGGSETGVILLRKGLIHGAYTQSSRDLEQAPGAIARLAGEREARIEVKSGAGSTIGFDVEAALRA